MITDANAMNSSAITRHSPQPGLVPVQGPRWFMLSAGGILLFGGITKLLNVFGNTQQLEISDPILGISFRQLLLCTGIVDLVAAYLCLFTNKRTLCLGLVAWLITIYAGYRVGLWTIGWYHPYPLLANLRETLDISPVMADGIRTAISAFLFIGSVRMLWIENRKKYAAEPLKLEGFK
jgi:uncharacterized membrane protein HdeD (DUF308 family)